MKTSADRGSNSFTETNVRFDDRWYQLVALFLLIMYVGELVYLEFCFDGKKYHWNTY